MERLNRVTVLPLVPLADRIKRRESERESENEFPIGSIRIDARRQPRFKIEVDVTINSRTCGMLRGRTVDISESGIAAMLPIEAPLGENVELNFTLPSSPVTIHAIVRHKNAFRYGFEFVESNSTHEVIRRTCRDLAIDQSPTWTDLR
jgi:c-di-GMP-binding flagellar brake protein YcgR